MRRTCRRVFLFALLALVVQSEGVERPAPVTRTERLGGTFALLALVVQSEGVAHRFVASGDIQFRVFLDTALASGIVLTGGSVMMDGVVSLAERIFNLPVRIGAPFGADGIDETLASPEYAAAVGLTRYGAQPRSHLPGLVDDGHIFNRVRRRMVEWFRELM